MNEKMIIIILIAIIIISIGINIYQYLKFLGTKRTLKQINEKINNIIESNSDEHVMILTDDKQIQKLLEQINDMFDQILRVKADFRRSEISKKKMLSNISHDIKTPMTVILGYLEIMRINDSCTTEMLGKVEKKAESVMELINQFFTLAKLESGDTVIELSSVNICEICRNSVLDFYEILVEQEYTVEIEIPNTAIYVKGNNDSIQRILFNLISNVTRYGSEGKYLGVKIRIEDSMVCIDVIDKGKGIDKQFASSVFERLFTMDDSRNKKIQGNGLGLTIAKNLANQLGGDLTLESKPNEKTVFTLKLKRVLGE